MEKEARLNPGMFRGYSIEMDLGAARLEAELDRNIHLARQAEAQERIAATLETFLRRYVAPSE